jgi:hypothetical protein
MDQATATLQQRIWRLDRKLPAKQLEELTSLVRLLGFELKPVKASKPKPKAGKPKFRWYRPPTLASLCAPYPKAMAWVQARTTAVEEAPATRPAFPYALATGLPTLPTSTPASESI